MDRIKYYDAVRLMTDYASWTARRDEIIITAYLIGVPAKTIADMMNIAPRTVYRACDIHDIPRRYATKKHPKCPEK